MRNETIELAQSVDTRLLRQLFQAFARLGHVGPVTQCLTECLRGTLAVAAFLLAFAQAEVSRGVLWPQFNGGAVGFRRFLELALLLPVDASDRRILFGLGPTAKPGRLTVRWAWGGEQHWDNLEPGNYWELREGEAAGKRTTDKTPALSKGP